jgi:helicase required for RNAi-mediated heterochromatin assembly 1
VRSNNDNIIGFLGVENRICVAFSRARLGFYIFGDFDCIYNAAIERKNLKFWADIINLAKEKNAIST